MLPLIRMAWTTNRRFLVGFSPFLAFYLAMLVNAQCGQFGEGWSPFGFFFSGIILMVTVIVTFQGGTLDVEGFLLALPVTRAEIVRSKYLTCLLGLMAGVALPLAVSWLAHALVPGRVPPPSPEALRSVRTDFLVYACGIFLCLPFVHHFGPAKGYMFFALALILALSCGLAWKGLDGAEAARTFLHRQVEQGPLPVGLIAGVLVFGLASVGLSTWSFKRRVF